MTTTETKLGVLKRILGNAVDAGVDDNRLDLLIHVHEQLAAVANEVIAEYDREISEGESVIKTRDPYWDKDELQHFRQLVRRSRARRKELVTIFQDRLGIGLGPDGELL